MGIKSQYYNAKDAILSDTSVCEANRDLFREFFEFEEYKLKRQNGLRELDDGCYRTLYAYMHRIKNVNRWFGNKPWRELTREDIKRVYDDLEDGKLLNAKGRPFEDTQSYYNKVFRSKLFQLAGKADLAREVIEFSTSKPKPVRFVTEESFRTLVSVLNKPHHLLIFWLAWDLGENIGALLKLTKRDLRRQEGPDGEPEYLVNLTQDKLKRSRQARTEPTLYQETARFADMVLRDLGPDDRLFQFGQRQTAQLMNQAVRKTGASTLPNGEPIRLKDLRSGMACHLLKHGWTRDEVNARLGHVPHSDALSAYINYLALDRAAPKRKLTEATQSTARRQLEEARQREKLAGDRIRHQGEDNRELKAELEDTKGELATLREEFREVVRMIRKGRSG